jgi:OOP family OmpA-OmpF porin
MGMRLPVWSRYFVMLTLLGSGVLLSATIDSGSDDGAFLPGHYSAVDPAVFDINYLGGILNVDGHSASALHEAELLQFVETRFGTHEFYGADIELRPFVVASAHWQPVTVALLDVVASSESAKATIAESTISLRAVVADRERWNNRFGELESTMPPGITLQSDVVEVGGMASDACIDAYRELQRQPVAFDRSSAQLRTATHALLDRHVDFALDCNRYTIVITGHTDNQGDESWNRKLGLARAVAVRDYLASRGIPADSLIALGAGSSQPVADNGTAWGRVRNRRIEFELKD